MNHPASPSSGKPAGNLIVTSPGAYPPVAVERPYLPYARMLAQDLASPQSEMTAISQYMYQSWAAASRASELAHALRKIAQVEMHHLDILGRLIVLLGGDPRFQGVPNNRRSAWSGHCLDYAQALPAMLQSNIAAEQSARNTYLAQANMVRDSRLAAILRKLAADEDVHIGIFRDFLARCPQEPDQPKE
ncbi:MAG TPA: manganese catalase family protein [Firmicutes bacterium]|nr:manganese catalase family protein [Bacillota bacterium]